MKQTPPPQRQHHPATSRHREGRKGSQLIAQHRRYLQVSVAISASHSPANKRGLITLCERLVGTTTPHATAAVTVLQANLWKPLQSDSAFPTGSCLGHSSRSKQPLFGMSLWLCHPLHAWRGNHPPCQPAARSTRDLADLSHPSGFFGARLVTDAGCGCDPEKSRWLFPTSAPAAH